MSAEDNPLHTPYDGSSKPFTIGLKALDAGDFIEVDKHLFEYLDEKDRLAKEARHQVIVAETGSEAAQNEVLELVAGHVCNAFPHIFTRTGDLVSISGNRSVDLGGPNFPPIHRAASLVQEDLVIMRKGDAGWYLSAASVCFPSAWNLQEKFQRPMHEIHRPVPGFGQGTRNAGLIERMFDNIKPGMPVIRWNWALYGNDRLYHPKSDHGIGQRFGEGAEPASINLRLERQTLQKLPVSGAILFTIRIHIDPIEAMERHPQAALLASSIIGQLNALSIDEIHYKGLKDDRELLLNRLSKAAGLPHG
jgi:hypothetical protein